MIVNLSLLRFLLATIVILFHLGFNFAGPFAVVCFYILSGHVSTHALLYKYSPTEFVLNRVKRLLPSYIAIGTVCYFVLFGAQKFFYINISDIRPTLNTESCEVSCLADNLIPDFSAGWLYLNFSTPLVTVYWTVFIEFLMYILLSIFAKLSKLKIAIISLLLVLASLLNAVRIIKSYPNNLSEMNQQWYYSFTGAIGYFFLGVLTYLLCDYSNYKLRNVNASLVLRQILFSAIIVFLILLPSLLGNAETYPSSSATLNWLLFSTWVSILTVAFLVSDHKVGSIKNEKFQHRRPNTQALGRAAYLIYVYQVVPFLFLRIFVEITGLELSLQVRTTLVLIGISVIYSFVSLTKILVKYLVISFSNKDSFFARSN